MISSRAGRPEWWAIVGVEDCEERENERDFSLIVVVVAGPGLVGAGAMSVVQQHGTVVLVQ